MALVLIKRTHVQFMRGEGKRKKMNNTLGHILLSFQSTLNYFCHFYFAYFKNTFVKSWSATICTYVEINCFVCFAL